MTTRCYCSKGHFASACQISCDSDSEAHDFYLCLFALCYDFRLASKSRKAMTVCPISMHLGNQMNILTLKTKMIP